MNDACRRISRGQVWFLVDNDVPLVHTQGSIQGKNRPWLVVSNNQCNQSSPIYTVVPLTTAKKNDQPTHVEFEYGDKTQTVLCEQIRTVSQQAFFNAGSSYRFTMSEEYMARVDEALAVQLGLSLVFPNADRYWASLEKLIRVRVKQAISDTRIDAVDISKIASLLDTKVDEIVKDETAPEPEKEKTPVEEVKQENTDDVEKTEPKRDWVPIKKSKRRRWTEEEKRKFVEYVTNYGGKAASQFYEMSLPSVYNTKAKFIKELDIVLCESTTT